LPNTYTVQISNDMAQELQELYTSKDHKMITLDIKYLYTNLTKQGINPIHRNMGKQEKSNTDIKEKMTQLLKVLITQNYF
jgi:hypothetical protein